MWCPDFLTCVLLFSFLHCTEITVDFDMMSFTVSEGDGFAEIILIKTGSNEIPVMVSVQTRTRDDTAEGELVID